MKCKESVWLRKAEFTLREQIGLLFLSGVAGFIFGSLFARVV